MTFCSGRTSNSSQPSPQKLSLEESQQVRIQKRFQKTQAFSHSQEFYQKQKVLRQRKQKEVLNKERQLKRIHQVQLLRQYRVGDLPDVEIAKKAIIGPLQALAQRDVLLAKQLLVELATALDVSKWADLKPTIETLLSTSTKFNSGFVNTLFQLASSVFLSFARLERFVLLLYTLDRNRSR